MNDVQAGAQAGRKVVSREQWLKERVALLKREKEFTHEREDLSRKRRELPWVRVDKAYEFDGPDGRKSLADLFAGRSQLIVYHFMFAPEWTQGCKSCSFVADHLDPTVIHLAHRDTSLAMVSKAPIGTIAAFQERMGWRLPWVSSNKNDFNSDYDVSFTVDEIESGSRTYNFGNKLYPIVELPGLSVFAKDAAGAVHHTYSTYARGLDIFLGTYHLLDVTPKGRQEDGNIMSWLRHHDRYDDKPFVDPWVETPPSRSAS